MKKILVLASMVTLLAGSKSKKLSPQEVMSRVANDANTNIFFMLLYSL
jgi:hypothetical protein